ncbi:hypothetical protein YPPY34_2922, partial [Yersinia pestis PY-34]|jgi:hypothetical protein
MARL